MVWRYRKFSRQLEISDLAGMTQVPGSEGISVLGVNVLGCSVRLPRDLAWESRERKPSRRINTMLRFPEHECISTVKIGTKVYTVTSVIQQS